MSKISSVRSMTERRSGIICIDKPAGISSAGVVARVKRALGAGRVGHAGTLDPDATGLLIVLINGATRVASYAADGAKVYSGEIRLGVTTTTDDLSGEVMTTSDVHHDFLAVAAQAARFVGSSMQTPPKVSAKKVGGKRAYKLQREGQEFELAAREVHVTSFDLHPTEDSQTVRYLVEVSPGTYVRSLARDLGEQLGCGAAVKSIRREASGYFGLDRAVAMDAVSWEAVMDWGELVPNLPRISVSDEVAMGLTSGQQRALIAAWQECNWIERNAKLVIYSRAGSPDPLGILKVEPGGGFSFELNVAR